MPPSWWLEWEGVSGGRAARAGAGRLWAVRSDVGTALHSLKSLPLSPLSPIKPVKIWHPSPLFFLL